MSEFAPPSYTGDPNAARCQEEFFKLGFWSLQIALAWNACGLQRVGKTTPAMNADTVLMLSEEARNRARERKGERRKTFFEERDKTQRAYQTRALDFRRQNQM